jgi:hypothetical protein
MAVAHARRSGSTWRSASAHGWSPNYADQYPWAGGPDHYAARLENEGRFKLEVVATDDLER